MILARNLAFGRAGRTLVAQVSLQLHPGWKVGLTGANGCGKSSFFALLRGELDAESGDLELPPAWRIGHVAQETPALRTAALDYVLDGDEELRDIEAALLDAEDAHDGHLDDYAAWLAARRTASEAVPPEKTEQRHNERALKKQQQAQRRRLEKEAERLERQLADWQAQKSVLEARLADPALYVEPAAAAALAAEDAELAAAIEAAETRWLEVQAQLEA